MARKWAQRHGHLSQVGRWWKTPDARARAVRPRLQEAHTRAGRGGWEGAEELAGGWRCCPLSWWQVLGSAQSAKRRQVYIVGRLLLYVYVRL